MLIINISIYICCLSEILTKLRLCIFICQIWQSYGPCHFIHFISLAHTMEEDLSFRSISFPKDFNNSSHLLSTYWILSSKPYAY